MPVNDAVKLAKETQVSSIMIMDPVPKQEYLLVENSKDDYPIELRIDSVTDYTALSFTLFVTVLTSTISALVTILLVLKSNNRLIESQNLQQQRLLTSQSHEQTKSIKSKYRQDWINSVRLLMANYLNTSSNLYMFLLTYINSLILKKYHNGSQEKTDKAHEDLIELVGKLNNYSIQIDLILSKSNILDREIVDLTFEYSTLYHSLLTKLLNDFNNNIFKKILDHKYLFGISEVIRMQKIDIEIKQKVKELLKNEWERVKNSE